MAGSDDETTPPGWYRQKDDPTTLRWWDGDDWTDDTMPAPEADRPRRRATPLSRRAAEREAQDAVPEPEDEAGDDEPETASEREPVAEPARVAATRPAQPGAGIPIARTSPPERRPAPRPTPRPAPERRQDDDWAAGAWDAGAPVATSTAATRIRQPATAEEVAARGSRRQTGDAPSRPPRQAATSPRDPRRPPSGEPRRPSPTGGAQRMGADPRRAPQPRTGQRPPQDGARRERQAPAGARTQGARTPRAGARTDDRVVQRGGTAPPGVRVALRALLIAVLLGVGYLGFTQLRDAEPSHARTLDDSEETEATVDKDATRLDQVVLALNDLPRGWNAQAVNADRDDICEGRVPLSVITPLETTKAAFAEGDTGRFITNVVSTFADEDEATAFLELTARTLAACRTYEAEGNTSIELGALEFPNFGDESFVAEAVGTSEIGEVTGDIVYVRVGSRVASIETISFAADSISPELLEHLTRLVANRM